MRGLFVALMLVACAVPELDRGGAIVCGERNLCPEGFSCELGRCCPADAGSTCPTLPVACVGVANASFQGAPPSTCVAGANALYNDCALRGGESACGGYTCNARLATPTMGFCFVPPAAQLPCIAAASIGSSCWEGRGVCVGAVQLGYDPMSVFGRSVVCIPVCSFPQGSSQARCSNRAICQRISGLTSAVCVPDCRLFGCGTSGTCDRSTGSCRQ